MLDILFAILPIFLVIGIGALAERIGFMPASAASALNAYAIRVAWPVLTIHIMANADPHDLFQGRLWLGFLLAHFLTYAVGYFGDARFLRRGSGPAVITAVSASSGMTAFVGVPIIVNLLPGNQDALLVAGLLSLSTSFTMSFALVQMDVLKRRQSGASGGGLALLRLILLNPLLLGLIIGIVICFSGTGLWPPLNKACALISASAAPCALISIGISYRSHVMFALRHIGPHTLAYQAGLAGAKLLLLPLASWALLALLGISGIPLFAAVMVASTGVAAGAFVIAEGYGFISQDCAFALVLTNVLSVFSLTGFAYLFIEVLHIV